MNARCTDPLCVALARPGHATCVGHDPGTLYMIAAAKRNRVAIALAELKDALAKCVPPDGLDRLAAAIAAYQKERRS